MPIRVTFLKISELKSAIKISALPTICLMLDSNIMYKLYSEDETQKGVFHRNYIYVFCSETDVLLTHHKCTLLIYIIKYETIQLCCA